MTDIMYGKTDLYTGLASLGIKPNDTVMMHSSYKSLGGYTGTPEDFLKDLCGYFAGGLLVLPAHTWGFTMATHRFDKLRDKTCIGLLPDTFLTLPGVYRSCNPTHSVAAYGEDADEFVSGEENIRTPCPRFGCHGKLLDRGGKILMLGCDPKHNTFIHAVEEWLDVPGRLRDEPCEVTVTDETGERKLYMRFHSDKAGEVSENYGKLVPLLEERGMAKRGKICASECVVMNCRDIYDVCKEMLDADINWFLE